ncbi:MAG: dipeptidase [Anaerolineales bacterium]|jgi:acetylornithine deacetylase/succinyl-diaminopimelate desuccinylase-like protein|nr:dipeptidase [Anaerolineales bacterium]
MSQSLDNALQFAQKHASRFVDQLGEFVSIPSVSTTPERFGDVRRAGEWVADQLRGLGMKNIQFFPPDTHPIIYAEYLEAGPDAPTALLYGHYDVQPAEPLDKWHSDPFSPTIRGENMIGRGASDMKGQVAATLFAVESVLKSGGKLPINLKFMIEGEEEIGSPHLKDFIAEHRDLIASDFCINTDTGMLSPTQPTIVYALRGLAYFELHVHGPKQDLHSGIYGGTVHNPAQALAELIAGMHDANGTVTLPGFYDKVRTLDPEERAELARLPLEGDTLIARTGVPQLWGEAEFTPTERLGARPTLEINGMYSGFIGTGAKTVLPAYAMAKISCRLVPDQNAADIKGQLEAYLKAHAPATIRWELLEHVHGNPSISDRNSRWVQAMMQAQETAWGVRPIFRREGGSVPVVTDLQTLAGMESINIGVGLPDDNQHGPDEKLHLPSFHKLIESLVRFFYILDK